MILHTYFRSTASWRVRIAFALKEVAYEAAFRNLKAGEQHAADFLAVNPQGFLPALVLDDGQVLTQSLAIVQYLDEVYPEPPLMPDAPLDRARINAFAQSIACDIHPVQNLKVLKSVQKIGGEEARAQWAREVIESGLAASAQLLTDQGSRFCFGDRPSLADIVLVPQLSNARRFGAAIPQRLQDIEAECLALPAFRDTRPEAQPDAPAEGAS